MSHAQDYWNEAALIGQRLDWDAVERMAAELVALRERGGRLFILGLGGSAANASHAVNDFRRLCHIDACTPLDNVAELTAAANDDGWEKCFDSVALWWKSGDRILVLSVGGGTESVSVPISNLVRQWPEHVLLGIVGKPQGYTQTYAGDNCIIVPTVEPSRVTPHTESFQSVILHCLVSHPLLQKAPTKW